MKILKKEVVESFGGPVKLGKALGISHSAVCQWGEFVPPLRAYQIHELMKQTGKCDRPDAEEAELADKLYRPDAA